VPDLPDPSLVDDLAWTSQRAPCRCAKILVERHVDRVEQARDLSQRPTVVGLALPQASSVQVKCGATGAGSLAGRHQVIPSWQLAAQVTLRELEQERRKALSHCFEIGVAKQAISPTNEESLQTVKRLVATLLVNVEVTMGVERHRGQAPALGVDPQRNLLRHRATRHPDGRLRAEKPSDAILEALRQCAAPVSINTRVGRGTLGESEEPRACRPVVRVKRPERPCACSSNSPRIALHRHLGECKPTSRNSRTDAWTTAAAAGLGIQESTPSCEDVLVEALLAQLASVVGDPRANVARAVAALEQHNGVRLALFPELFLSAYELGSLARTALAPDGPELDELAAAAARTHTAVVVGFAERLPAGEVANSAACIDETGTLVAVYRKTQLFGAERDVFRAGGELRLVSLAGLRVGPLICYDVEFPELGRALAVAGAELLVTVSANMAPYGDEHEVATRARALENRLPHLYANAVGTIGRHRFVGRSRSVGAAGDVLADAGEAEELLVAPVGRAGAVTEEVDYLRQLPETLPVV
jgi:predicted amidohydrolase